MATKSPTTTHKQLLDFLNGLYCEPAPDSLESVGDNAQTVVISHVEMTLDKMYLGLWSTEHFKWERIMGEMCGSLELVVTHPVTKQQLRRTGAAAIRYDDSNFTMALPLLKAECTKNAAKSLGKVFGRDLNRSKKASYVEQVCQVIEQQDKRKRGVKPVYVPVKAPKAGSKKKIELP